MKLPSQMKYQMEKKGMNSMKKRSLKKKDKKMPKKDEMHMMPDGSMMKGSMAKMKKMAHGGVVGRPEMPGRPIIAPPANAQALSNANVNSRLIRGFSKGWRARGTKYC